MLVSVVTSLTAGDRRPGWIPGNLNSGHLDKFYFLFAALSLVDLAVYVTCVVWYKARHQARQQRGEGEQDHRARLGFGDLVWICIN
ncbi:hypothetical protein E2562_014492 [Oryza meyeriana var. granulata]|uniref:Uncharacterized protein n=1 Tax=Oryza meyeriana var. granulata TaxID=110450 RepID=A0A6G1CP61_9ORYZ|nr:hypothetical protein E2562_014492 [Oryza meyeriana var. granulata]